MVNDAEPKKIMTKPLPQILDESEESIRSANDAAKNARSAVEEAYKAGEKAARDAARIANERVEKVEQIANNALQLAELLKLAIMDGVVAVDKRLSGKAVNSQSAPKK